MGNMTSAEFEALATAALEASEGRGSGFRQDLQRERATLACLRLQARQLDQVIWFLLELALEATTAAERARWCELGEVVVAAATPSATSAG